MDRRRWSRGQAKSVTEPLAWFEPVEIRQRSDVACDCHMEKREPAQAPERVGGGPVGAESIRFLQGSEGFRDIVADVSLSDSGKVVIEPIDEIVDGWRQVNKAVVRCDLDKEGPVEPVVYSLFE